MSRTGGGRLHVARVCVCARMVYGMRARLLKARVPLLECFKRQQGFLRFARVWCGCVWRGHVVRVCACVWRDPTLKARSARTLHACLGPAANIKISVAPPLALPPRVWDLHPRREHQYKRCALALPPSFARPAPQARLGRRSREKAARRLDPSRRCVCVCVCVCVCPSARPAEAPARTLGGRGVSPGPGPPPRPRRAGGWRLGSRIEATRIGVAAPARRPRGPGLCGPARAAAACLRGGGAGSRTDMLEGLESVLGPPQAREAAASARQAGRGERAGCGLLVRRAHARGRPALSLFSAVYCVLFRLIAANYCLLLIIAAYCGVLRLIAKTATRALPPPSPHQA